MVTSVNVERAPHHCSPTVGFLVAVRLDAGPPDGELRLPAGQRRRLAAVHRWAAAHRQLRCVSSSHAACAVYMPNTQPKFLAASSCRCPPGLETVGCGRTPASCRRRGTTSQASLKLMSLCCYCCRHSRELAQDRSGIPGSRLPQHPGPIHAGGYQISCCKGVCRRVSQLSLVRTLSHNVMLHVCDAR